MFWKYSIPLRNIGLSICFLVCFYKTAKYLQMFAYVAISLFASVELIKLLPPFTVKPQKLKFCTAHDSGCISAGLTSKVILWVLCSNPCQTVPTFWSNMFIIIGSSCSCKTNACNRCWDVPYDFSNSTLHSSACWKKVWLETIFRSTRVLSSSNMSQQGGRTVSTFSPSILPRIVHAGLNDVDECLLVSRWMLSPISSEVQWELTRPHGESLFT